MKLRFFLKHNGSLITGDVLSLAGVTLVGFATHGELATAGARLLTTLLPLTLAWFLVAPFLGVYDRQRILVKRELWRPLWAMIVAAPLAAWMRGLMLGNVPIQPVFVAVLGAFSALGMLAWRSLYLLAGQRRQTKAPDGR
jgi:hypothetical protein